jgi:hypothetical protein
LAADEALDPFDHADPDDRLAPTWNSCPTPPAGRARGRGVPVDEQLDALVGQ